jgi:hypothetical protein
MTRSQTEDLARWLYLDPKAAKSNINYIRCVRAAGVHLIGRDLMYALCHTEYLVFMNHERLPLELRAKLGTLRLMKHSEAADLGPEGTTATGYKKGLEGYMEAASYVYKVFD